MRQRLLKSLRIAVTTASLLVCGLLIVLWVRSYTYLEHFSAKVFTRHVEAWSCKGYGEILLTKSYGMSGWRVETFEYSPNSTLHGSWSLSIRKYFQLIAPYWFYLTIFATIAALPWIKWLFSLRTLLIVVTLFALFFGAIAISL